MLCLPEYNRPYLIDSLQAPIAIKYHWVFNAPACDFMLSPITYLEETTGGAVKVRINNSEFWIPAAWHILVTDRDTFQLDTVSIQACASTKHLAFAFSPNEMKLQTLDIMVLDFDESMSLVHPMIAKATALIHPVGPAGLKGEHMSVVIGPFDLYKHLDGKVVGDLMS